MGAVLMLSSAAAYAAPAAEIRTIAADAPSPAAKAEALNMLAGEWISKTAAAGFSTAQAGEIAGYLYIFEDGKPGLHELWAIKPKGDSLAVMQAFYLGDLSPRGDGKWTERRLVAIDPKGKFYFNNMTLTATKTTMQIAVQAGPDLLTFDFTRAK
jgi:hypothetical protein